MDTLSARQQRASRQRDVGRAGESDLAEALKQSGAAGDARESAPPE